MSTDTATRSAIASLKHEPALQVILEWLRKRRDAQRESLRLADSVLMIGRAQGAVTELTDVIGTMEKIHNGQF